MYTFIRTLYVYVCVCTCMHAYVCVCTCMQCEVLALAVLFSTYVSHSSRPEVLTNSHSLKIGRRGTGKIRHFSSLD